MRTLPLPTRDPFNGGPLVVTRLENPETGVCIEGRFDLGWIAKLTKEQLDFVLLLLRNRANVQRLAADAGIAYNTARNRLDDIVRALDGAPDDQPESPEPTPADDVLEQLATGEITHEDAIRRLRQR